MVVELCGQNYESVTDYDAASSEIVSCALQCDMTYTLNTYDDYNDGWHGQTLYFDTAKETGYSLEGSDASMESFEINGADHATCCQGVAPPTPPTPRPVCLATMPFGTDSDYEWT